MSAQKEHGEASEQIVKLTRDDLNGMMREAATAGAREALAAVGLHDEQAAGDLRDLRGILEAYRSAKSTVWQTIVKVLTTAVLAALIAGLAIKFKIGG